MSTATPAPHRASRRRAAILASAALTVGLAAQPLAVAQAAPVRTATAVAPVTALAPAQQASAPKLLPPAVPQDGVLFGASVGKKYESQQAADAVADLEDQLGRTLDLDRSYSLWDDPQPSTLVADDLAKGRLPYLSIFPKTRSGQLRPWGQIAAGGYDGEIRRQADQLKGTGKPILLAFHHEPDNAKGLYGTPADFKAAFRHYVQVFRAEGASNVAFSLIMLPNTYGSTIDQWYPGDDVVDWIAADPYNFNSCTSSVSSGRSLESAARAFYTWGSRHGKPLALAEWGSYQTPGQPGTRAQWLRDAEVTLSRWPDIKAISYFDHQGSCPWWINDDSAFASEFKKFANGAQSYGAVSARLAGDDSDGPAPLTRSFDLGESTGSGSPAGTGIASWSFDPGDGSPAVTGTGQPDRVQHTYAAGTWTPSLTVTDANGQTTSAEGGSLVSIGRPTVHTGSPQAPFRTTSVNSWIDTDGLAGTVHVEYGTTSALGSATADQPLGTSRYAQTVTAALSGLAPGTTYYWRLVATTAAGSTATETRSFVTAGLPTVKASGPSRAVSSASITGWLNGKGRASTWWLEYGTTPALGQRTAAGSLGTGYRQVTGHLAGLRAGQVYYWRVVAANDAGTTRGPVRTISTGTAPTVRGTGPKHAATSATVTGYLNGKGLATRYWVEYGRGGSFDHKTSAGDLGSSYREVHVKLSGLAYGSTYRWRLVASNAAGTTRGAASTITTAGAPHVKQTTPQRTQHSATVRAWADPEGLHNQVWIEWGTTDKLGSRTKAVSAKELTWATAVSLPQLTGLKSGTRYYYRVVVSTAAGTARTSTASFTTRR